MIWFTIIFTIIATIIFLIFMWFLVYNTGTENKENKEIKRYDEWKYEKQFDHLTEPNGDTNFEIEIKHEKVFEWPNSKTKRRLHYFRSEAIFCTHKENIWWKQIPTKRYIKAEVEYDDDGSEIVYTFYLAQEKLNCRSILGILRFEKEPNFTEEEMKKLILKSYEHYKEECKRCIKWNGE